MEEQKIALNHFDLSGLIRSIFSFMRKNDISPSTVVCFSKHGEPVEGETYDEANLLVKLIAEEQICFLPFSDINVGQPIPCADGNCYSLPDPGELDEEVALTRTGAESVGYLIQVRDRMVEICPAVFRGGDLYDSDSAELEEDLKEFKKPMADFIKKFIKK